MRKCSFVLVLESVGVIIKFFKKSVRDFSIFLLFSKFIDLRESCGLMCRICYGGSEDEEFIRLCKCIGIVKYVY